MVAWATFFFRRYSRCFQRGGRVRGPIEELMVDVCAIVYVPVCCVSSVFQPSVSICCTPSCSPPCSIACCPVWKYLPLFSECATSSSTNPPYLPRCILCPIHPQPMEVYIDDETKLTLHGLQQHYLKLQDREKNRKLFDLLDVLEFNQVS